MKKTNPIPNQGFQGGILYYIKGKGSLCTEVEKHHVLF